MTANPPLPEMRGITKRFPGAVALDGVDFDARRGEVHILLGENDAGKSTLIKILTGVYPPDEGQILLNGQAVRFENPGDAQRAGIGVIYQEPALLAAIESLKTPGEPRRSPRPAHLPYGPTVFGSTVWPPSSR